MLSWMKAMLQDIWPFNWLMQGRKIIMPKAEPMVPEFELPEKLGSGEFIYNPDFYATEDTTKKLMSRFNGLVMFIKAIQDTDRQAPSQWHIRFDDGAEVNAGQLGRFFCLYPEDKYPGIAFRFAISYIAMVREERRHG
jgi:hypothetical protein